MIAAEPQPMAVESHPLRITERDVIKEQSLDEWFNSFQGLDLHIRVRQGGWGWLSDAALSSAVHAAVMLGACCGGVRGASCTLTSAAEQVLRACSWAHRASMCCVP